MAAVQAQEQGEQRAKIREWLEGSHATSATLSASTWVSNYMTDDITLQFGNNPLLTGIDAVRGMFEQIFPNLDLMEHYIEYFDFVPPDKVYQAARIRYRVKGDDTSGKGDVEIPGFAVFWVREEGDKLKSYRMETYLDPSPLLKRMEQVLGGKQQ